MTSGPITSFPLPHSQAFLTSSVFELMLGGGRGAGKSVDLMGHPMTPDATGTRPRIAHPLYRGLVLRRSMPQLKELIDITFRIYPHADPGAVFNQAKSEWRFSSGGRLEMSFLEHDDQKQRYWGRGFHDFMVDELEHWPHEDTYLWLHSSVRSAVEELPCYIRVTANPTGPGALWCRRRFFEPGDPGTLIKDSRIDGHRSYRAYIHAVPRDNYFLGEDYIQGLRTLPSHLNKAFEHGDWYATEGVFFDAWDERVHVIEPFVVPYGWKRIRSIDYGYKADSAVIWAAEDPFGGLVIYRELVRPEMHPDDLAKRIVEIERAAGEYPIVGPADAQCWESAGHGFSIADRLIKGGVRIYPSSKGPNSRMQGAIEMHRRLRTLIAMRSDDGDRLQVPALRVFRSCKKFCKVIPSLVVDPHNNEDVLEGPGDDIWDATRYLIRARPMKRKRADEPGSMFDLASRRKDKSFEERWRTRRTRRRGSYATRNN